MCMPSQPTPPSPAATAAGQTTANIQTGFANNVWGNPDTIGPNGTTTWNFGNLPEYDPNLNAGWTPTIRDPGGSGGYIRNPTPRQGGIFQNTENDTFVIVDAATGTEQVIPRITVETTLSEHGQAVQEQTNRAQLGLATFAADQVDSISNLLSSPLSYDGMPAGGDLSTVQHLGYQNFGVGQPKFQTGIDAGQDVLGSISGAGQGLVYSTGGGGGFQYGVDGAGEGFIYDVAGAGQGVRREFEANAGQGMQYAVDGGGQRVMGVNRENIGDISFEIGDVGDITRSYNTDFSADRARVEEALLSRINPELQRDEQAYRTRLANQGIHLGSEAFDRGEDSIARKANDARFGAVLAGGQEQSRLANLARDHAIFENAAQQQAFNQEYARMQAENQAAGQALGQELAIGGFTNNAVNAQFGENLARGNFVNDAQGQYFGQSAQEAAFNNQGQAQGFGQRFGVAELSNQATNDAFGQRLASAQLNNQAVNDAWGQMFADAQMNNQAQAQAFNQNLAAGQFSNQAQQQMYNQAHNNALFGNTWSQAGYQNDQSAIAANNALADQRFNVDQVQYGMANQERDRAINEATNLRNQQINEITALLGLTQIQSPGMPSPNMSQLPTVDYAGLVNDNFNQLLGNANLEAAGAQGQQAQAVATLLAILAAAGSAYSDIRLKRDIKRIGKMGPVGLYRWRYLWDRPGAPERIGIMAQEVQKFLPAAVLKVGRWLMVDYGRVIKEWGHGDV